MTTSVKYMKTLGTVEIPMTLGENGRRGRP
jgi:hypothetical protein